MGDINWDSPGAIGDFGGSIGVFISLIYLAVQMRHSFPEAELLLAEIEEGLSGTV